MSNIFLEFAFFLQEKFRHTEFGVSLERTPNSKKNMRAQGVFDFSKPLCTHIFLKKNCVHAKVGSGLAKVCVQKFFGQLAPEYICFTVEFGEFSNVNHEFGVLSKLQVRSEFSPNSR